MALSQAMEEAFDAAIEAAYAVEEAGRRWARNSEEISLVSKLYNWRIEEYDLLSKKQCLHHA